MNETVKLLLKKDKNNAKSKKKSKDKEFKEIGNKSLDKLIQESIQNIVLE